MGKTLSHYTKVKNLHLDPDIFQFSMVFNITWCHKHSSKKDLKKQDTVFLGQIAFTLLVSAKLNNKEEKSFLGCLKPLRNGLKLV